LLLQAAAYRQFLEIGTYRGLDIQPEIVAANQARVSTAPAATPWMPRRCAHSGRST